MRSDQLVRRNKYKFVAGDEVMLYVGKEGSWHQFVLESDPYTVWAEVLDEDLNLIVEI